MSFKKLIKEVPPSIHGELSDRLVDILLEAKEGENVPSSKAKEILKMCKEDRLSTDDGLVVLIEAAKVADSNRVASVLDEFKLVRMREALTKAECCG